jgi:N-acetyl-alpha-D-muramate 1-phosphate uridylyltransferase
MMPSTHLINHAMVLAAGLGTRMRPITLSIPKPLVAIDAKPMLDHALDRLGNVGVAHAVVNVHYLAEQIIQHVACRQNPPVTISDERGFLLETGGGIKKALPLLGDNPFWLMNSDSLWIDAPPHAQPEGNHEVEHKGALSEMQDVWDPAQMDILLLLANRATCMGYDGRGDFQRASSGHVLRRSPEQDADYVYAGVAILKPELFIDTPDDAFSLNLLFDRAIAANRLYGHVLDGEWLHVGTPEAIGEAQHRIERARLKAKG